MLTHCICGFLNVLATVLYILYQPVMETEAICSVGVFVTTGRGCLSENILVGLFIVVFKTYIIKRLEIKTVFSVRQELRFCTRNFDSY